MCPIPRAADPKWRSSFSPVARVADFDDIVVYTRDRWGAGQAARYASGINDFDGKAEDAIHREALPARVARGDAAEYFG